LRSGTLSVDTRSRAMARAVRGAAARRLLLSRARVAANIP